MDVRDFNGAAPQFENEVINSLPGSLSPATKEALYQLGDPTKGALVIFAKIAKAANSNPTFAQNDIQYLAAMTLAYQGNKYEPIGNPNLQRAVETATDAPNQMTKESRAGLALGDYKTISDTLSEVTWRVGEKGSLPVLATDGNIHSALAVATRNSLSNGFVATGGRFGFIPSDDKLAFRRLQDAWRSLKVTDLETVVKGTEQAKYVYEFAGRRYFDTGDAFHTGDVSDILDRDTFWKLPPAAKEALAGALKHGEHLPQLEKDAYFDLLWGAAQGVSGFSLSRRWTGVTKRDQASSHNFDFAWERGKEAGERGKEAGRPPEAAFQEALGSINGAIRKKEKGGPVEVRSSFSGESLQVPAPSKALAKALGRAAHDTRLNELEQPTAGIKYAGLEKNKPLALERVQALASVRSAPTVPRAELGITYLGGLTVRFRRTQRRCRPNTPEGAP